MSISITEAFKKLDMLDEAFFNEADEEDMEELDDIVKSDFQKADDATKVIDDEAETEADLEDDYVGKVVIECPVCKNTFFKDEDELEYDEDSNLVNVGEECSYCLSNDGFEIVGKVEPFVPDDTEVTVDGEEVEVEEEGDEDEDIDEIEYEEDEDIEESCCCGSCKKDKKKKEEVKESFRRSHKLTLDESFEEASVKTGDTELDLFQDPETQEITVKSRPRQSVPGEGMIGPMEDEELDGIMGVEPEEEFGEEDEFAPDEFEGEDEFAPEEEFGEEEFEEEPIEGEDEFVPEEEIPEEEEEDRIDTASYHRNHGTVDVIMEDFDDAGFDYLGENFFKKVYDNVDSFKTVGVKARDNSLVIEGLIDFKSGNQKKTSFILESDNISKNGLVTFKGINNPIKHGKRSFSLTGRVNGTKLMCESLRWHYKQKDEDGIVRRVYGSSVKGK